MVDLDHGLFEVRGKRWRRRFCIRPNNLNLIHHGALVKTLKEYLQHVIATESIYSTAPSDLIISDIDDSPAFIRRAVQSYRMVTFSDDIRAFSEAVNLRISMLMPRLSIPSCK